MAVSPDPPLGVGGVQQWADFHPRHMTGRVSERRDHLSGSVARRQLSGTGHLEQPIARRDGWVSATDPARRICRHGKPERGISKRLCRLGNIDYTAIDLDGRQDALKADLTALPFTSQFDLVLCSHVLEHIPDDHKALREMRRVLRPGGIAVMQHPIDRGREKTFEDWAITTPEERDRIFFQSDHVRIYGRDIEDRIRNAGFAVQMVLLHRRHPPPGARAVQARPDPRRPPRTRSRSRHHLYRNDKAPDRSRGAAVKTTCRTRCPARAATRDGSV